ncbi:sensor histidine kinase [Mesonia aquimarina]|uniref:sensor histidine kinase n=1 Tax=Mesonia aquimarina TaxID=1504967 RepID=UPI000EF57AEE|nr:HAMP domain-containing sensor histidine kinase [Mesonia aquimarina]
MIFNEERKFTRWFIIISSLSIIILFLWNIAIFFNRIKQEERNKMEIWVSAYSEIVGKSIDDDFSELALTVLERNTTTPMIFYTVKSGAYDARNISDINSDDEIKQLAKEFESEYEPIPITDGDELLMVVYYGNSNLLNNLKYFPIGIFVIVFLFLAILYYFYSTAKEHEQSKLWAGMAKETAHQIGTPLSSLVGWAEILRSEKVNPSYIAEIEKDISRLRVITERFSKIGSLPTLEKTNLVEATQHSYDYLSSRTSKLINFSLQLPKEEIIVNLNEQLFSWTVENLVKNAIDALRGKGDINIDITQDSKYAYVHISDTGKGIAKANFKKVFQPGYTTKKRGWGLGLSLARRIMEEYHEGKIRVLKSEANQGTTFEIQLKKA